ncbi:MAG: glutamate--tRNA ligase [Clostridia bacterium]|nr:glutamate--tRNA ligase [Clostridia bacterium]
MDFEKLADLLFPEVTETPEDLEKRYPERSLPEGAKVTRFAPSPTGFIHLGGIYGALIDERLAHQSGGIFYLRIEDTDSKREVEGAAGQLISTLADYGLKFDEGATVDSDGEPADVGDYGPYRQSMRRDIYSVYGKKLVSEGHAYPVFMTRDELTELNSTDKKAEVKSKVWDDAANESRFDEQKKNREITLEEVENHLKNGDPFTLRILADGDGERKVKVNDLVRGALEIPENDEDFVLLKSDGIPTYHFAHAVDDHLMRTTHVIRGEEWLPSLPKHVQLFRYLGFRPPKYLHTAQIMKLDENGNKKKLSKRDLGLDMKDYERGGYDPECVCEYVMTLLNSNFDEWRLANPDLHYTEFPFSIKKMSNSGCLLDLAKLGDVSKNVISRMTAEEVLIKLEKWTAGFDAQLHDLISGDREYALSILSIGRGGKKPRKDIATWRDARDYMSPFYDELFEMKDAFPEGFDNSDVVGVLSDFRSFYNEADDSAAWFAGVKSIGEKYGFCPDMKLYKASPESYKGSVADVSSFLRVAVTGRMNSPDLYTVMHVLGRDRTLSRIDAAISLLEHNS